MASNQQPKMRTHIALWNTNPRFFVAQEAVKRHDFRRCHLSDDAIMKLAINKREKFLHNAAIEVFESVSVNSLRAREKRKRRGAPALAPDGTVMSIMIDHKGNDRVVLNGGRTSLRDGGWTVENYHTKSDHPSYRDWLSRIVWTADEAVNKGIPREAINTPLPDMRLVANQNISEQYKLAHPKKSRAGRSQPNYINDNSNVQDEQVQNMAATPSIEQLGAGSELSPATNVQGRAVEPQGEGFESLSPTPASVQMLSDLPGKASAKSEPNVKLEPRTGSIEQITERDHKFTRNAGVNAARVRTSTASMTADRTNSKGPLTTCPSTNRSPAGPAVGQANLPQTASPAPILPNPLKRKAIDLCDRTITFKVKEPKLRHGEEASFNFSESLLLERAPAFYTNLKEFGNQLRRNGPPIYDVAEKPKLFEAILHWIDHGFVMRRPYLAHSDLETYYLDLYRLAVEVYELPGLSNAVIDALHEWHSRGDILLEKIDVAYSMTELGDGLRLFYFDCLLAMSSEEFEGMVIEEAAVSMDLFEAAKRGAVGHGVKHSMEYHSHED